MDLTIARLHHPVTTLGPGRRLGIWFQGCGIRCAGCMSTDTWEPVGATVDPSMLANLAVDLVTTGRLDGITVSGGEPMDQPRGLARFLELLRPKLPEADVLLYSGYTMKRIQSQHPEMLALVDAVMAGPYQSHKPTDLPWRGSANQELVLLTQLARRRFADAESPVPGPRVQVGADSDSLWLIGIPPPGALAALEEELIARGIVLGERSWKT